VVSTFDTSCEQLVHLANATEVWLMFDGKALRKGNDNRLRSAVKGRKQLRGIHINSDFQFALNHQEASSSTLKYVKFVESESKEGAIARLPPLLEAAMDHTKPGANPSAEDAMLNVLLSIEDVAEEAVSSSDTPPSYESVSLGKRPRTSESSLGTQRRVSAHVHSLGNSPTSSLVAKRFFQDVTYAPSGAGRAQSTTSSTNTVQVDLFQDAITTAVKSVLPDMLIAELPTIVRESISVLLARSPYPSSKPPAYQISNALEQHCSTPSHKSTAAAVLRADVSEHTKSYLEELLNNVAEQVSEQVEELHSQHVSNVEEMLDDHKTNVRQVEEDQMAYLNEKGNEKLAELETSMDDIKERMAGEVEETVDAVENTVLYNLLVEMQRRCECKCKCAGSGKDKPALKAMSLPP
jgi:hypothetical protein